MRRQARSTVSAPPLPAADDPIWRLGMGVVALIYAYLVGRDA